MTNNTSGLNGWIYFIRAGEAIKIGFSVQPKSRAAHLQTSHHQTLEVLATVPTSVLSERQAHQRFHHLKIRGEWFRAEEDLLKFIDDLNRPKEQVNLAPPRRAKKARKPASAEMNSLMALRSKHGADSPVGCRCSNLIGQLRAMETAQGEQRESLTGAIKQQATSLKQLLAA